MTRAARPGVILRLLVLMMLPAGPALVVACRDRAPTEAAQVRAGPNQSWCDGNGAPLPPECAAEVDDHCG